MKDHKYQQIRVRVTSSGESVRFSANTDKLFARVRGLFVSMPKDVLMDGTLLGLRIAGEEVFDDAHEVRLLTCGHQVAPGDKFFEFEELLEAAGSTIEGRLTDGQSGAGGDYPYDAKIYLWLETDVEKPMGA